MMARARSALVSSPALRSLTFRLWLSAVSAGLITGLLLRVRTTPDVDLWLHLRIGDFLRSGRRFGPSSDPLAVLADREYVPSQWFSQASMSAVYEAAGMTGIQVARLLLVVGLGSALLVACRLTAGPAAALFATSITMFAAAASWGERPQLAGMVLLALTTALWWRACVRGSVPWAVIPVTWVWTMVHGSWVLGVAVSMVLFFGGVLDRCWRGRTIVRVAAVPVLSVTATLMTPLGVHGLLEPFRVSAVARLTANEWQRPALDNPLLLVVLAAAVVVLLGLVRSSQHWWARAFTVVTSVVLALWMVRTIAVGAIVLAPALAHGLAHLTRRPVPHLGPKSGNAGQANHGSRDPHPEWPAWVLAVALVLALGGSHIATTNFGAPVSARVSAALSSLPADSVLAVDGRAVGWAQWAHRDRRPLRDLRAEVYSIPVATGYENFQEARSGWQKYADAQGMTSVLADRERPLDAALLGEPSWTVVAEDSDFRLWVHR